MADRASQLSLRRLGRSLRRLEPARLLSASGAARGMQVPPVEVDARAAIAGEEVVGAKPNDEPMGEPADNEGKRSDPRWAMDEFVASLEQAPFVSVGVFRQVARDVMANNVMRDPLLPQEQLTRELKISIPADAGVTGNRLLAVLSPSIGLTRLSLEALGE